jgi:hypothetical protein
MSRVINSLIDGPTQHSGLQGEIEWRIRDRIERLEEQGYYAEAARLEDLLRYSGYPEGYR